MPTERLFLHEENLVSQDFNKTSPKVKFRRESLRPFCSRFGGGSCLFTVCQIRFAHYCAELKI